MLFDTNFLIAYSKGSKEVNRARCRAFLESFPAERLYISRVTWMEFLAGFENSADAGPYMSRFSIIEVDSVLWWDASRVVRELGLRGKKIGVADSIIAATALTYGLSLVSNNTKHFREVSKLDLRGY